MEWQPIETAPKDGTRILVITKDGVCVVARWEKWLHISGWTIYRIPDDKMKWIGKSTEWLIVNDVSEWMPLPPPPKD